LAAISWLGRQFGDNDDSGAFLTKFGSVESLRDSIAQKSFPTVAEWSLANQNRITIIPPGHWLLISDTTPFRASLQFPNGNPTEYVESIPASGKHIACLVPRDESADASLHLERYALDNQHVNASIRFLDHASRITHHVSVFGSAFDEGGTRNTHLSSVVLL